MLNRVIGVMKLDVETYEEIEADESATPQAAIVVTVVAVIGGLIGGGISVATGGSFLGTFLNQLLVAYIGWGVWSVVTYFVGTSLFGGKSDIGQMLRVLGFAQAPGILGIVPICGAFVGWLWTLACTFIAIRQGLDLDNQKALLTAIVAFICVVIVSFAITAVLTAVGLSVGAAAGMFS
jgi:hypothetical protein